MPDPISWSVALPYLLAALVFGYLCGSIPFGLLLGKAFGLGDVRKLGSGNIGATNVLRTGNKKVAFLTLLGDMLKGTFAVVVAARFGPDQAIAAGLGAFLGHCFPVWLKFSGGKGVATYIGILLGLFWKAVPVFAVIWLATALISRYSSLAALLATIATPVTLYWFDQIQTAELFVVLTVILWVKHHANILRLVRGTESRIGNKG